MQSHEDAPYCFSICHPNQEEYKFIINANKKNAIRRIGKDL